MRNILIIKINTNKHKFTDNLISAKNFSWNGKDTDTQIIFKIFNLKDTLKAYFW